MRILQTNLPIITSQLSATVTRTRPVALPRNPAGVATLISVIPHRQLLHPASRHAGHPVVVNFWLLYGLVCLVHRASVVEWRDSEAAKKYKRWRKRKLFFLVQNTASVYLAHNQHSTQQQNVTKHQRSLIVNRRNRSTQRNAKKPSHCPYT